MTMGKLQTLASVRSEIEQAERVAAEAAVLKLPDLAKGLLDEARELSALLDAARSAVQHVAPTREQRRLAYARLSNTYVRVCVELEPIVSKASDGVQSPRGRIDVAERARFCLRHLPHGVPAIDRIVAPLQAELCAYEASVDNYLLALAEAETRERRALLKSQHLHLELERARCELLERTEV